MARELRELGSGQCASARHTGRSNVLSDPRKSKEFSLYSGGEYVSVETDYNPGS